MRFYISGPISGTKNYHERFRSAAQRLKRLGIDYVNPAEIQKAMPEASHDEYLRVCLRLLTACQALVLLPGAEDSAGSRKEWREAKALGMPIFYDAEAELPEYTDATTL